MHVYYMFMKKKLDIQIEGLVRVFWLLEWSFSKCHIIIVLLDNLKLYIFQAGKKAAMRIPFENVANKLEIYSKVSLCDFAYIFP